MSDCVGVDASEEPDWREVPPVSGMDDEEALLHWFSGPGHAPASCTRILATAEILWCSSVSEEACLGYASWPGVEAR